MFSFHIQLKSYLILSRFFRNCYHLIYLSRRPDKRSLPETSARLSFGAWICRGGRPGVARFFTAPCFRLSPGRGRTKNHCPKLHRGFPSVHGFVAAAARALPCFSPRLAFGCRPGAAKQKIIARNFRAAFLRCMDLSRRPPGRGQAKDHCPKLHRGFPSVHRFVAATARALPGFSPRLAFGCRSGAARQKIIARNFTAAFLRCMDLSRRPPGRCPVFRRALLSVVARARLGKRSLPEISARLSFGA